MYILREKTGNNLYLWCHPQQTGQCLFRPLSSNEQGTNQVLAMFELAQIIGPSGRGDFVAISLSFTYDLIIRLRSEM